MEKTTIYDIINSIKILGGVTIFRRKKRKRKKVKKVNVNGWNIIIKSNKPIEEKGVIQGIADYAVTASEAKDKVKSLEALIILDFFGGCADVSIDWIDEKTSIVKIRQKTQGGRK